MFDSTNDVSDSSLHDMIIVNGLGALDNEYGPEAPEDSIIVSPAALAAARASGLTAINITMAYTDAFEASIENIAKWDRCIREHPKDLVKIFTRQEILLAKVQNKIGIIYGLQNAAMVGSRVERIDVFTDFGVRAIQLTYNGLNQLGGGCMVRVDPGLTEFGERVVERLNARRVMVDLSHSGRKTCLEAARVSKQPICISHTGCAAITDVPRNATDAELRVVADSGGYVGIYFMMYLTSGRRSTRADVLAHLDHAIDICGEDHVGFGSDYGIVDVDYGKSQQEFWKKLLERRNAAGEAAVGERPEILPFTDGLTGPNQFRALIGEMDRHGYKSARIEKIMGQNYLRYAGEIWGT